MENFVSDFMSIFKSIPNYDCSRNNNSTLSMPHILSFLETQDPWIDIITAKMAFLRSSSDETSAGRIEVSSPN